LALQHHFVRLSLVVGSLALVLVSSAPGRPSQGTCGGEQPHARRAVGETGLGEEGKNFEIITGPWELVMQEPSTAKAAIGAYNHPVPLED
jgi:hypothetical protein